MSYPHSDPRLVRRYSLPVLAGVAAVGLTLAGTAHAHAAGVGRHAEVTLTVDAPAAGASTGDSVHYTATYRIGEGEGTVSQAIADDLSDATNPGSSRLITLQPDAAGPKASVASSLTSSGGETLSISWAITAPPEGTEGTVGFTAVLAAGASPSVCNSVTLGDPGTVVGGVTVRSNLACFSAAPLRTVAAASGTSSLTAPGPQAIAVSVPVVAPPVVGRVAGLTTTAAAVDAAIGFADPATAAVPVPATGAAGALGAGPALVALLAVGMGIVLVRLSGIARIVRRLSVHDA